MKKWLIAVMFGVLLILGACGSNDDNNGANEPADNANNGSEEVDVSAAEESFQNNCATCHGDDLSGDVGPDLTAIGSEMSKDQIEKQIENGGDGMPPGLVEGDERNTLAQWLSEKK